jgi:DNA-binding CsgD family transcriptional regulator
VTTAALRDTDLRSAFALICDMIDAGTQCNGFAYCGVQRLPRLVASDLTTLSICNLASGQRQVIGAPGTAIGADERATFDRHFNDHPLVRYHAVRHGTDVHRISDSIPFTRFRESSLHSDYYRRIGIDHAAALPVFVDRQWLVSFVLNRRAHDFSDREVALLNQVRPAIAGLFRRTGWLDRMAAPPRHDTLAATPPVAAVLTPRERDVMHWVAAGKTDRDVADILAISHRTVHKHLQQVYNKLGVETRTAAVMRVFPAVSSRH